MFASLTSLVNFSVSALMRAMNSSGVLDFGSEPPSIIFCCTSGIATILTIAAFNCSTIGRGVWAGALLSTFFPIFPEVGANFILIAFVVVALGGFGSVTGAFWAGIIVGVVEVLGGFLIGPEYKLAIVLALFLLVILVRPQGLMGRA